MHCKACRKYPRSDADKAAPFFVGESESGQSDEEQGEEQGEEKERDEEGGKVPVWT